MIRLAAFAGYARSGKDTAALCLMARGYVRCAFGDIIKGRVASMTEADLARVLAWTIAHETPDRGVLAALITGFRLVTQGKVDPFTESDAEKAAIRPLLERYGEAFYDEVLTAYMDALPERAVNTRLVRCREAEAFRARGGIVIEIVRPGADAATDWERDRLAELRDAGHIGGQIVNDGTTEALHAQVLALVGL